MYLVSFGRVKMEFILFYLIENEKALLNVTYVAQRPYKNYNFLFRNKIQKLKKLEIKNKQHLEKNFFCCFNSNNETILT